MKTTSPKQRIPNLVKKGFDLHQQLTVLNEEFKKIKERLKAEAVARPGEHDPTTPALRERTLGASVLCENLGLGWERPNSTGFVFRIRASGVNE